MKTQTNRTAAWAIAALGAWPSLAAAQEQPTKPKPPTPGTQAPGAQAPGSQTPGRTGDETKLKLYPGDRLVGMDLFDSTGGRLGRIGDVVLRSDGRIAYVVTEASADGSMKMYPIPWHALKFESNVADTASGMPASPGRVMTTFDKERFKTAPSFTSEQWSSDENANAFTEADRFYGQAPPRPGDTPRAEPRPADAKRPEGSGMTASALRLTRFRNMSVTDASGRPVGTIGQVVVDPMSGRMNYVTLSLSDAAANGRVVAIPWEAIHVSRENDRDRLQLAVPSERLSTAPQFQPGEESWKQMSDPAWVGQMYSFYSIRPYWTQPTERPGGERPPGGH